MNMESNKINRDLKEIDDLFYTIETIIKRDNYLETQTMFEQMLFSKNYKYCTNEQISFLIDKFFENYKYVNYTCAYNMYKLIYSYFPELVDKFITSYLKHGNILVLDAECNSRSTGNANDIVVDSTVLKKNLYNCLDEAKLINLLYAKNICGDDIKISFTIKKRFNENEKENMFQLFEDASAIFCWLIQFKDRISEGDNKKLRAVYEFIYLVTKDICRNEEKDISDIELLGAGGYSAVFGIGNKVLKLGLDRQTISFPNNPYVVPMLLRKELEVNDDIYFFVEVTERCKNNVEVSHAEHEELLDKLFDIDINWVYDCKCNLGRVSNPDGNVISWKENLYITDEVLGLEPYRGNEVLKQGDLVILDNDYLYDIKRYR